MSQGTGCEASQLPAQPFTARQRLTPRKWLHAPSSFASLGYDTIHTPDPKARF